MANDSSPQSPTAPDAVTDTPGTPSSDLPHHNAPPGVSPKVPEQVPIYSPNHSPIITQDLRSARPEEAHASELAPFSLEKKTQASITIPRAEYNRLKTLDDFRLLAVDFSRSEIPAQEALDIARIFNDKFEKAEALPASSISRSSDKPNIPSIPIDGVASTEKIRWWSKLRRYSPSTLVVLLSVLIIFLIAAYFIGRLSAERLDDQVALRIAASQQKRTFTASVAGWNTALAQAMDLAKRNVIWITSNPSHTYTWETLSKSADRGLTPSVFVIGNRLSHYELFKLASYYNLRTHITTTDLSNINIIVIDDTYILSGDDLGIWFSIEPRDVHTLFETIKRALWSQRRQIFPRS